MSEQQGNRQRQIVRSPEEQAGVLRTLYERGILTWKLLWDRRVGFLPKLIPLLALAYIVSPVDLLPALVMGPLAPLGALDDVGVMLLGLNLFVQAAPPDVVAEYLRELSRSRTPSRTDEDVIEGHAEIIDE
jgi:uncharacterized membrane protein YkvA (DUF1232 family)